MTLKERLNDILKHPGRYRKAIAAFVTSAFGTAAVFGFADPNLQAGVLTVLGAITNLLTVYGLVNKSYVGK
jgi:hypothetical protein